MTDRHGRRSTARAAAGLGARFVRIDLTDDVSAAAAGAERGHLTRRAARLDPLGGR
ncbi:hypothetical protein [Streptomyces sp. NRRL S-340]|uniref:hypothetical protein n=1 Tax=Streptomyces sp. NRRL S-340 TaxID=1463901 RepID=UPI000A5C22E3|nr:hypothetical protein [Streptomyces sp. NRRL S-340]